MDGSNFTATLFNVAFTPKNKTLAININGVSSISGNVSAQLEAIVYGFTILNETLDPCELGLHGMCPMSTGQITLDAVITVGQDVVDRVPGIAYGVPDIDALVRITVIDSDTGLSVACVQAALSNTKTVYQKAVGWVTAIIAGSGLVASGITSGMGHTNTAAHVAANALSLFGFFQAQALIGMSSVTMPPIVQSWTQNFQWSMGIIRVGFIQSIATWYQRSTGGTPTTYISTLATTSVQVEKRAVELVKSVAPRAVEYLSRRADAQQPQTNQQVVVRGIDRVGFRAGIEQTNIFMTGLIFFIVIMAVVALLVALFKGYCEVAVKANWMKQDKFVEFRNGWRVVLKGILFRLVNLLYYVLQLPLTSIRFSSVSCKCQSSAFGNSWNETAQPKLFLPLLPSSAWLEHSAGHRSRLFDLQNDLSTCTRTQPTSCTPTRNVSTNGASSTCNTELPPTTLFFPCLDTSSANRSSSHSLRAVLSLRLSVWSSSRLSC